MDRPERAISRLFAYTGERRQARRRQERTSNRYVIAYATNRYVIAYATVFALSFAIGQAVLPPQDRAETNAAQVILTVVLLVIAGTAAIAATH